MKQGLRDHISDRKGQQWRAPGQPQQTLEGEEEGPVLSASPSAPPPRDGGLPGSWRIGPDLGFMLVGSLGPGAQARGNAKYAEVVELDDQGSSQGQSWPQNWSFQQSVPPREGRRMHPVKTQLYKMFLQTPERRQGRWRCCVSFFEEGRDFCPSTARRKE